jgi:RNA polymerase sigma-70 factor (ECF subfamily)
MTAGLPKSPPGLRVVPGTGAEPAPAPLDDAALLAAVRAGDSTAAAAFCRRIRPIADRTVRRLLGRLDEDGRDLVQNALIELVYKIDRYRGECALDHWVSTVTAHLVFKHIRRRKLERRLFSRLLAGDEGSEELEPAAPGTNPLPRAIVAEVLGLLDLMNDKQAWAFVLHDVCGYDLKEIAQITGASAAAAQSRLVRGRKELHRKIAAHPDLADLLVRQEEPP